MKQENTVINAILSRRSVRQYTAEQVTQEALDIIIQCAVYAPSALHLQSWQVRVVQNRDLLQRLNNSFVEYAKGKELKGSAARA
ncbi:MAG: nitroreductase family protein, partial [Prevotellaceae bacterium]|nr:nitroreductase family protein [Prevotellaceae bacterium]